MTVKFNIIILAGAFIVHVPAVKFLLSGITFKSLLSLTANKFPFVSCIAVSIRTGSTGMSDGSVVSSVTFTNSNSFGNTSVIVTL